jgi:hypothetical protein
VQVDRRAERAFLDVGRRGLAHVQLVEQFGGEDVEVEAATAVRTGRGLGLDAVDAHAGKVRTQTAHRNGAAFAAFAGDGHAGHPGEGFGQVVVRELGDVLGDDGVDDRVGLALDVRARSRLPRKPVTTTSSTAVAPSSVWGAGAGAVCARAGAAATRPNAVIIAEVASRRERTVVIPEFLPRIKCTTPSGPFPLFGIDGLSE